MTVKSNYKLDARIKSMDDVQTCLHYDDSYIGERGYFASDLCDLSDLSNCAHDTLAQIILDGAGDDIFRTPHDVDNDNWGSRFFIPDILLKPIEKKYRAFTLVEFLARYKFGDVITYRIKDCEVVEHSMLVGFQSNDYVLIGNCRYSLKELFNNYELNDQNQNEWQPFGVIEE